MDGEAGLCGYAVSCASHGGVEGQRDGIVAVSIER